MNNSINILMMSSIFRAAFKEIELPAPEGLLAVKSPKSPMGFTLRCILMLAMYAVRRTSDSVQQMLKSLRAV